MNIYLESENEGKSLPDIKNNFDQALSFIHSQLRCHKLSRLIQISPSPDLADVLT